MILHNNPLSFAYSQKRKRQKRTAAGRSSTGISPRPMLMGAPRNDLRAFNAGVSLSCLCILAHRSPHLFCGLVLSLTCLVGVPSCGLATGSWRTGRPAPNRQIVSVCLMLPKGFLCQGAIQGATWKGGNTQRPALNQLRSKFRMEIISFVSSRLRISSSTKE